MLYGTPRGLEDSLHEGHMLSEFGLSPKAMTGPEVNAMESSVRPDISGGVYYEGDGYLDPQKFVTGLAAALPEKGVSVREGVEVLGLDISGGSVDGVSTSAGTYRAEQVVLAAGSWSPGIVDGLPLKLPVQPAKGYSMTYAKPGVSPTRPLILGEARVGVNPMGRRGPLGRHAGARRARSVAEPQAHRRHRAGSGEILRRRRLPGVGGRLLGRAAPMHP